MSLLPHLGAVAAVCAVVGVLVARSVPSVSGDVPDAPGPGRRRFSRPLAVLCGLAVAAALVEAVPYSWSAVYLAEHTGAAAGLAGLGFTAFTASMVLARLLADRLVARLGPVLVVRAGALAGGLAMAVALASGGTAPGIVAFAVMGLGAAAVFPAMITAAGAMPGQAIQAMNLATRVGFMAAPPLTGLVADGVGLPTALGLVVVPAALALAVFAGAVRPPAPGRDAGPAQQPPART